MITYVKKNTNKILIIITVIIVVIIMTKRGACLFNVEAPTKIKKIVTLLSSKKDTDIAKQELLSLIKLNGIKNLPKKLDVCAKKTDLTCFRAIDKSIGLITSINVLYSVGSEGCRGYSFVFDASDNCLFHSKDLLLPFNGGLLDVTGDGHIEKVVDFLEERRSFANSSYKRLQIFTLQCGNNNKLLDVKYNYLNLPYVKGVNNSLALLIFRAGKGIESIFLEQFDTRKKVVDFVWDKNNKLFKSVISIAQQPKNWEMLYPIIQKTASEPNEE